MSSRSGEASRELLYSVYFTFTFKLNPAISTDSEPTQRLVFAIVTSVQSNLLKEASPPHTNFAHICLTPPKKNEKGISIGSAILHRWPACVCYLWMSHAKLSEIITWGRAKLQRVQNYAARIVLETPRRSHASPLLRTIHWLPVRNTSTPSYLRLLIQDREHGRNLRSTTTALCQPFATTTFAKRAFRCSAPAVWNSLPQTVLSSDSVAVFKSRLKTFLFSQAFSSFSAH